MRPALGKAQAFSDAPWEDWAWYARRLVSLYRHRRLDLDEGDLTAAAYAGLLKAAAVFDPSQGSKPITCAQTWIMGALREEARTQWRQGRPRPWYEAQARGEEMKPWQLPPHSFDAPVENTGDEDIIYRRDRVPDPRLGPEEQALLQSDHEAIRRALSWLPAKERLVLHSYYWEGRSWVEIGTMLGRSQSRVHQLRNQAFARLRGYLAAP